MKLLTKIRMRYYGWRWMRHQNQGFEWIRKTSRTLAETNPTLCGITHAKVEHILVTDASPKSLAECNARMVMAVTVVMDAVEQEQRRLSVNR
jgi:hypothetical protein